MTLFISSQYSLHFEYMKKYLKLDIDHHGLLRKYELAYSWVLTSIFIDKIFEAYQTFGGEMDYKTFLDFVLAIEIFWRILNVNNKRALDTFVINMFFRTIIQKLESNDKFGFHVDYVKDEFFIWQNLNVLLLSLYKIY